MAFEASTLVNGEWTTRTLDVNTVLRHYDQQDQDATADAVEIEKAPVLGLLTQTVIGSPVVHWILPAKLRDSGTNDVAFIGDEFVQIKQLRRDGHLWDVIRKENFGARIRNACIVGSAEALSRNDDRAFHDTHIKQEDNQMDIDMKTNGTDSLGNSLLPPQVILLQLETGDSVFLMLRRLANGALNFVSSRHRVSKTMLKMQPGIHLAVDASSRYMIIGCSESVFAIYALRSREDLQEQYSRDINLRYVETERHIFLEGVIYKIEFLYPCADDERHVILLVLVIRKGKTRMLLYDWETGDDLRNIRAHSHRGHLLEEARQMPLLVIPLRIKSAFILVSERSMSICRDILQGSPNFIDINDPVDPPTDLFHGSGIPLWTSWARPVREDYHTISHDDIYFVREDGLIKLIETDADEEDLVKTEMSIGQLSNSCGPAFACLDFVTYYDDGTNKSGDLLLASGDSCAGGAYLTQAREAPTLTEWIHNWTPAQDFVTSTLGHGDQHFEQTSSAKHHQRLPSQPDRIFTCSGKGSSGTVTEFRCGLEAGIGLEMTYDAQIMDIWVMSSNPDVDIDDGGSLFLLSLGDRSSVLHLSNDASEISELEPHSTRFDLTSRTLAASVYGQNQMQVTEQSIVFISRSNVRTICKENLLGIYRDGRFLGLGSRIELAVVHENVVLFTTRIGRTCYVRLAKSNAAELAYDDPSIPLGTQSIEDLGIYPTDATCLGIGVIAQNVYMIIAEHGKGFSRLMVQSLNAIERHVLVVPPSYDSNITGSGAIVSIVVISGFTEHCIIVCGTRNGVVITLEVDEHSFQIVRCWCDRIGETPAIVRRGESGSTEDLVFINCDLKMFALTITAASSLSSTRVSRVNREVSQIFFTDALKPLIQQPVVNSMGILRPSISGGMDRGILLVSGPQILLAGLNTQSKAVPRYIPIGGWPSRLLYSHHLECLIVAASVKGKSTLLFIDPETGVNISRAFDRKNGNSVDFVSGLGNFNEKVLRLLEWSYVKGGKIWMFIIVCLNTGRLLIISTQKSSAMQSGGSEETLNPDSRDRIHYWTLHKIKCGKPVYSVTGSDQGLFYCSGDMLYCEALDDADKRFKRVAEYSLPSPALDLTCRDGKIHALTAAHSLEILKVEHDPMSDVTTSVNGTGLKMIRTHGDQVTRNTLHHNIISNRQGISIDLISDKSCSVIGLWPTHGARADTLEPIFEAQLPCSILRFRTGNSRPLWDTARKSIGGSDQVLNEANYPETLGLSIDGSLFNFTLIDFAAWKFLRFLENLARQSLKVCEYTCTKDTFPLEPCSEPKVMMHVDGDILRHCLASEMMAELLRVGQETEDAVATQATFVNLLHDLHRGRLEKNAAMEILIEQAYRDLEVFLRPVL